MCSLIINSFSSKLALASLQKHFFRNLRVLQSIYIITYIIFTSLHIAYIVCIYIYIILNLRILFNFHLQFQNFLHGHRYQVTWAWNKMDNVPVSRYQFKENLLFRPERKVAILIEFTRKKSQQPATLQFFALALVEHGLTAISSCSHLC